MKFSVSGSLHYHANEASTLICSLRCHLQSGQRIEYEDLTISREANLSEMTVGLDANRLTKLEINSPGDLSVSYIATVETFSYTIDRSTIRPDFTLSYEPVSLPYLSPSRYAPADRMRILATELFGNYETPVQQAIAIEDWLFHNISYQIGASNEQSWSLDTYETRSGVCRDFAHLGIAFCRALNIPARYVTVYAHQLEPQDFHAVFEAFIDGQWLLFDGTRKAPLNGMVRIASGRDAAETPLASLFGNIQGCGVGVSTQCMDDFEPITRDDLNRENKVIMLG